jgi:hypothetical protein
MEYYENNEKELLRLVRSPIGGNYFETYQENNWVITNEVTYSDWANKKISLKPIKSDKVKKKLSRKKKS